MSCLISSSIPACSSYKRQRLNGAKTGEGWWIWDSWAGDGGLKPLVLLEQAGGLDPLESENHQVWQRQHHLADAIPSVSLSRSNLSGQCVVEADPR